MTVGHLMARVEDPSFGDLLGEVAHDAFTVATWGFTAITLFVVALALYRLVPRRPENLVEPPPEGPGP